MRYRTFALAVLVKSSAVGRDALEIIAAFLKQKEKNNGEIDSFINFWHQKADTFVLWTTQKDIGFVTNYLSSCVGCTAVDSPFSDSSSKIKPADNISNGKYLMQGTRRVLNYRLCFRISKHRTLHQIMILKLDAFAKAHKLISTTTRF